MALTDENRAVVTDIQGGGKLISTPDGINSELVSEFAVSALAADLQGKCNGSATGLQPERKGSANRFVPAPNQAGKPLIEDDEYKAVEPFISNPEWIIKNSNGEFTSIEDFFTKKLSITNPLFDALQRELQPKGISISQDNFSRRYFPLYRLKQKDKEIAKGKKINVLLTVLLTISLSCCFLGRGQKTDENMAVIAVENTDSVCTAAELHEYVKAYSELKHIKIYPFSEKVILNRINEMKITDIEGIKNEIDKRVKELQKR